MIVAPYEVALFGDLALPSGGLERWRALALDVDVFVDWPESFGRGNQDDSMTVSIGQWLDDCAHYQRSGPRHFLEFGAHGQAVTLRGYLEEPEYNAYHRQLAAMFRHASTISGRGSLTIMSSAGGRFLFAYRVDVSPGVSTMRAINEGEVDALPNRTTLREIVKRVEANAPAAITTRPSASGF